MGRKIRKMNNGNLEGFLKMKRFSRWSAIITVILLIYSGIRINSLVNVLPKVKETDDTPSYVRASKTPFWNVEAQIRAPTYPILIGISGGNLRTTAIVQTVFSILSWGFLAYALSRKLQTRLFSIITFVGILIFSLDKHIIGWDTVIQTESLSISLMCVLIGLWAFSKQVPGWWRLTSIFLISLLWAFTRDTNAYLLLLVGLFLLLIALFQQISRRYIILSVGFGIIFILSYMSFTNGGRWIYPFQNVLAKRILNNSQSIDFFAKCGMPVTPSLLTFANARNTVINKALTNDPSFSDYRVWRDAKGRSCYMSWLLSTPVITLVEPLLAFNEIMEFPEIDRFFQNKFVPVLPVQLSSLIYPEGIALGMWIVSILLQSIGLILIKPNDRTIWILLALGSVLLYPHVFIIYHGDTNDLSRHAITASVQLFFGFWLTIAFMAEHLWLTLGNRLKIMGAKIVS